MLCMEGAEMKVGDLIRYKYPRAEAFQRNPRYTQPTGVIISVNTDGGTLKVLDQHGNVDWFITSYCEVVSESPR